MKTGYLFLTIVLLCTAFSTSLGSDIEATINVRSSRKKEKIDNPGLGKGTQETFSHTFTVTLRNTTKKKISPIKVRIIPVQKISDFKERKKEQTFAAVKPIEKEGLSLGPWESKGIEMGTVELAKHETEKVQSGTIWIYRGGSEYEGVIVEVFSGKDLLLSEAKGGRAVEKVYEHFKQGDTRPLKGK